MILPTGEPLKGWRLIFVETVSQQNPELPNYVPCPATAWRAGGILVKRLGSSQALDANRFADFNFVHFGIFPKVSVHFLQHICRR